jgi:hypothetical protein
MASLPRPGVNLTGFNWLAMMFSPDTNAGGGTYQLPSFETAARWLKVAPIAAPVRTIAEIETVVTSLGREPGSGPYPCRNRFCCAPAR